MAVLGVGPKEIGHLVARLPSEASRELGHQRHVSGQYRTFTATGRRILRCSLRPLRLETNETLHDHVDSRFARKWSPGQISRALRGEFQVNYTMRLAPESIELARYLTK